MNRLRSTMHFLATPLLNPANPLTVYVIGAGGTGSQVVTALARMNHAMTALDHPGLQVSLWDDDKVSPANLGRQLFAEAEIGLYKAEAIVNRTNRFFGTNWKARPHQYARGTIKQGGGAMSANLFISCVDTVRARIELASMLADLSKSQQQGQQRPYYWMDFGNSQQSGQVILASVGSHPQPASTLYRTVGQLPFVTDEFDAVLQGSEDHDNTPSCSLAEALEKQDLFINSTLANMGCSLLWNLFRGGMTPYRGFFLNLKDHRSQPLKVA